MNVGKIVDVNVNVDGKKYITIYDHDASGEYLGRRNCAFFEHAACDSIDDCYEVIFRPYDEIRPVVEPAVEPVVEPPKYTVADFVEAFSAVVHAVSSNQIARVSDYLEKKHNADYQLYLELKKRFEK